MTSNFKVYKKIVCFFIFVVSMSYVTAQANTNEWKLQLALGLNYPSGNDQGEGYAVKGLNFPTVNLGVQHMFTNQLGAKLDFGFNRFTNDSGSNDFKVNYSRVNVQGVYDLTQTLGIFSNRMALVAHAGPGMTFSKPLGDFAENKYTFLNGLVGLELHYGISETFSIYGDVSYIHSFSGEDKYDPAIDGYSYNDNLVTFTVGLSVSLSGCTYCN
ncbi:outer membrane beta-barrel protein [Pontimicrobium sp. IMCC45349]|uniref:outer membrane beta-barrel protein n=1 Tax=Pontimicrobium sp. IMCC45349 TaxID=3391574 RepID=UPI0039A16D07